MISFKSIKKKFRNIKGNSLAEFAVTTAMMATLATTAAPRFSGIGEGAKEKKTLAEIDKIVIASSNFFNSKVTTEGRGRFPGQEKYNVAVGGYDSEIALLNVIGSDANQNSTSTFNTYNHSEGSKWRSIFGVSAEGAALPSGSLVINDNSGVEGHKEFMAEFANNAIKSAPVLGSMYSGSTIVVSSLIGGLIGVVIGGVIGAAHAHKSNGNMQVEPMPNQPMPNQTAVIQGGAKQVPVTYPSDGVDVSGSGAF